VSLAPREQPLRLDAIRQTFDQGERVAAVSEPERALREKPTDPAVAEGSSRGSRSRAIRSRIWSASSRSIQSSSAASTSTADSRPTSIALVERLPDGVEPLHLLARRLGPAGGAVDS
jgi:hypothetical protein